MGKTSAKAEFRQVVTQQIRHAWIYASFCAVGLSIALLNGPVSFIALSYGLLVGLVVGIVNPLCWRHGWYLLPSFAIMLGLVGGSTVIRNITQNTAAGFQFLLAAASVFFLLWALLKPRLLRLT